MNDTTYYSLIPFMAFTSIITGVTVGIATLANLVNMPVATIALLIIGALTEVYWKERGVDI